MYNANYYQEKKQELQQESVRNKLEAYDDILRVLQKAVNKDQEFGQKFQKVVAEETASQEQTKKTSEEVVAEPAEPEKKP